MAAVLPGSSSEARAQTIARAYPHVAIDLARAIVATAGKIGADPFDLANEIRFESNFNPAARNVLSSATGLIQFIEPTAKRLGTTTAALAQLSAVEQMAYVERYLAPFRGKLGTPTGLAMAVFYPAALSWPPGQEFSASVQRVNPGIKTPADYVRLVLRNAKLPSSDGGGSSAGGEGTDSSGSALITLSALKHELLRLPTWQYGLILSGSFLLGGLMLLLIVRAVRRSRGTPHATF